MTSAAALLALLLAVGMPPESDVKACEQQARAEAGAPMVSPHSPPHASAPTDDSRPPSSSGDRALRRETPSPTKQDRENANTPLRPAADGRDTYRADFQTCLRARGN